MDDIGRRNSMRGGREEVPGVFGSWPLDGGVKELDQFKFSLCRAMEAPVRSSGPVP